MNKRIEILIVEDSPTQAMCLQGIIEKNNYHVLVANNGEEALVFLNKNKPEIVISDIVMPGMNGYQLCRKIKADDRLKDISVILLTSLSDPTDVIRGLECGADNFMTKPYDEQFLVSRIQSILINKELRKNAALEKGTEVFFAGQKYYLNLENRQILDFLFSSYENIVQKNLELQIARDELKSLNDLLEEKVKQRTNALSLEIAERKLVEEKLQNGMKKLQKAMNGTINTVSSISEIRDPYTAGHERRVAQLATAIAEEMGLSKEQNDSIYIAGLLHDVGKIAVPIEILNKPGKLRICEFDVIRIHPQVAYDILKNIEFPWPIGNIVLQHHEKLDGSGYPSGLRGEEIILEAKILAVADVVEAMASHRPYRPSLGIEMALNELLKNKGVLYDPEVVETCVKLFTTKGFTFEA